MKNTFLFFTMVLGLFTMTIMSCSKKHKEDLVNCPIVNGSEICGKWYVKPGYDYNTHFVVDTDRYNNGDYVIIDNFNVNLYSGSGNNLIGTTYNITTDVYGNLFNTNNHDQSSDSVRIYIEITSNGDSLLLKEKNFLHNPFINESLHVYTKTN